MGKGDGTCCQFCGDPMDAGSEFLFLVEAQVCDEEVAPLELIQASPRYHGEPLRVFQECRSSIEGNRLGLLERAAEEEEARSRRYRKVLAIVGVVAVLVVLALIIADLRW